MDKERLMTSGEGGILPRGIPVGIYSKEINKKKNNKLVIPSKNWDKLNILRVILYDYEKSLDWVNVIFFDQKKTLH